MEQGDERFLELIVKRIQSEKCILILGPDIQTEGEVSIHHSFKEYLSSVGQKDYNYYGEEDLFGFVDAMEKEFAYYHLKDFCDELMPESIHKKIAEIPFHLIISLSADMRMNKAFEDQNINFNYDFYNKEERKLEAEIPQRDLPLLYGLFGDADTEGSLILTHEDLFAYLQALFGNNELQSQMKKAICEAKSVLFIGFQFEKWYFRLITQLLKLNVGKINHAPSISQSLTEEIRNLYSDEFNVQFLNSSAQNIVEILHSKCDRIGILRRSFSETKLNGNKMYISYAWGGKSEEITSEVCKAFATRKILLRRDITSIDYKGNINSFMKEIGTGDAIVLIVSDKYLKSEYCMHEFLEVVKNPDHLERMFPIVLPDANIYDEISRIDYLEFWDKKTEELKTKINHITNPIGKINAYKRLQLYADICAFIDDSTELLRTMNTLKVEDHTNEGYERLIQSIVNQIES